MEVFIKVLCACGRLRGGTCFLCVWSIMRCQPKSNGGGRLCTAAVFDLYSCLNVR